MKRTLCGVLSVLALAGAADLSAKHMRIMRLPDGDATIFEDSVVITDGDTRIDAGLARMYETKSLAVISRLVRIKNPDAEIWADSARYQLSERVAELFSNVRVRQESMEVSAPKLLYLAREKKVRADSGLTLINIYSNFRLTGRRGTYDLNDDSGIVDSLPVLTWKRGKDSARVTSREMFWRQADSRALARGTVKMKSGATELDCDTIVFFSGPDSGRALGKPEVRDSASRASGDTMTFRVRNGSLERVFITNGATGEYRTEGGDSIVVRGRTIDLQVVGGDIDVVEVGEMTMGQLIRTGKGAR
jgi:lipopolysaccharide export system protein LptA